MDWLSARKRIQSAKQPVHQPLRRLGDHRARREDLRRAGLAHRVEILRRDDAAGDDHDVGVGRGVSARRSVPGSASGGRRPATRRRRYGRRCSIGELRDLLRRLEHRADGDVEAEIGKGGGDDLLAAVVAVLSHLGDEDARRWPVFFSKASTLACDAVDRRGSRRAPCGRRRRSSAPWRRGGRRPFPAPAKSRRPSPWRARRGWRTPADCRRRAAAPVSASSALSTAATSRVPFSCCSLESCRARTSALSIFSTSTSMSFSGRDTR